MGIDREREMRDWRIPALTMDETFALQRLARGEADAEQQKKALAAIVHKICMTHDETFSLDSERLSSWYQGRRSAGNFILKELQIDLRKLREDKKDDGNSNSGKAGRRSGGKRPGTGQ